MNVQKKLGKKVHFLNKRNSTHESEDLKCKLVVKCKAFHFNFYIELNLLIIIRYLTTHTCMPFFLNNINIPT